MGLDTTDRHPSVIFLNLSATGPGEEAELDGDKVIWKDLLVEGTVARTPGMKKKVPFKVVAKGRSSSRPDNLTVSFEDLIKSFDARAFPDVTIPDGHPKPDRIINGQFVKGDSAFNNTGYVHALRVVGKPVKKLDGTSPKLQVLQCAMGLTEPDKAAMVKRGTVPNVSAGIFFDFVRKADDRYFSAALNHVALTKNPWMGDLGSFERAYFAEDGDEYEFGETSQLVLDDTTDSGNGNNAKVVWDEEAASRFVRDALSGSLNPSRSADQIDVPQRPQAYYYVDDVTHDGSNLANVQEEYRGKTTHWVIPWSRDDSGTVTPAPQTQWVEGRQAMIAASDELAIGDVMAEFEDHSYEKALERINLALADAYSPDKFEALKVSTHGKALVRKKDDGSEFLFDVKSHDGHVFLADDGDWELVKLPRQEKRVQQPPPPAKVEFDLSSPAGRVAAARQRRNQSALTK